MESGQALMIPAQSARHAEPDNLLRTTRGLAKIVQQEKSNLMMLMTSTLVSSATWVKNLCHLIRPVKNVPLANTRTRAQQHLPAANHVARAQPRLMLQARVFLANRAGFKALQLQGIMVLVRHVPQALSGLLSIKHVEHAIQANTKIVALQ